MNDFLIKGTISYLDYQTWKTDPNLFSSRLLSVIQTWESNTFHTDGRFKSSLSKNLCREYGLIKQAHYGLSNDIHSLSVNYHLLNKTINDDILDNALKELYCSLLVENYFVNIRSIYDYTSFFPKIIISESYVSKTPSGSLNELINFLKKNNHIRNILTDRFINTIVKYESDLVNIRAIRDAIIHHGKEPIVSISDQRIIFGIPKTGLYGQDTLLPNILDCNDEDYPLFEYLKTITNRLIEYIENLGDAFVNELYTQSPDTYRVDLTALGGLCIKDFMNFLYPDEIILPLTNVQ